MKIKLVTVLSISAIVSACGGSGSGDSSPNNSVPSQSTVAPSAGVLSPIVNAESIQVFGSSQVQAGSAAGFAIVPKGSQQIDTILWEQTSGPSLTFLTSNSQTIGFDVPSSGNYSLVANVQMAGQIQTTSYSVEFSATGTQQAASIRVDHTVSELAKVSLHLGIPDNKTISNVSWVQLGGPTAQNIQEQDDYLFFDAPSVSNDSVLSYRANVQYADGTSDVDDVFVTVKNVDFQENGLFFGNDIIITEDMHAYRPSSRYASALENCVYDNRIPNPPSCTFQDLPLIGMETLNPTVENILNRTLVSHDWMGERFEDYLKTSAAGPDMLNLLRGVTAVIISYDVRPSFYWSATGAIYLDANNFWQTPAERDTLNDQPDFRSDFGSDLQFSVFWRYTKDNEYYPNVSIAKQNRIERDFSDVEASISWLMYHELAHANDFFPPDAWASISDNTTPLAYFRENGTNSDILNITFPLTSSELHSLAQVRFANATPTNTERNYDGQDIERFLSPDIAPSFYSYFTEREDFATLVERFMMLHTLDAEADVAIIDGRTTANEPLVVWGQRNRISESSLEDRAVFAITRVYPELTDVRSRLRGLPVPVLMAPNQGWFENLVISPQQESQLGNSVLNNKEEQVGIKREPLTPSQFMQLEQQDTRNIHTGRPQGK